MADVKKGTKEKETRGTDLDFSYLPQFARWILDNSLDQYAKWMLELSRAENIPLLKFFSQYPEEQMLEMGKISGTELLNALANNEGRKHIESSVGEWIANRLSSIDRDVVVAEDIALISQVRRQVFRLLLENYAKDILNYRKTMEEVDRYTAVSDIAAFNGYIRIHQEKIQAMNSQLQVQREDLLEAQELAKMGSFHWDLQGKGKSEFTPTVLKIFEMEKTGSLESFIEDVHPDDRQRLRDALTKAMDNENGFYECEYRYIRNNKTKRIWSRGIVEFEDGKPTGMRGTIMDITAKSELLEKLQESEELHKQAQALTHIGNWSWDILTNVITWSDEMYRIYGLEPQSEKITFERFMELIHPENRASRMEEIQRSLETKKAEDYILRIVTPAGEEKILKGKGELVLNAEEKPVWFNGTCQDITAEYRLNHALQEQEEYMALLINNAPDAVIVIDEQSIIRLWNPKAEAIFGWTAAEVLGHHLGDTIIPPRYREAHNNGMRHYLATGEGNVINRTTEVTAMNNRNEELFISLTISQTIQDGRRSFIAFIRDVTEERLTRIELKNKTQLLEQKNRELEHSNKELESFNYAASHDLQEPLRKIQIFANRFSEEELEMPPKLQGYLDKIISSSARMQNLINDLLIFSQTTAANESSEYVDLSFLVTEAKNMLGHLIEESGTQISHTKLPVVRVVSFQFLQVFINLLSNAIKYRKPGVPPDIWIGSVIVNHQELGTEPGVQGGNYLKLSIADNGIGFDPQFADRLFDLFTRLHNKEKYPGTGIGLAICKKIVQLHQGFIRAESDGHTGSTFHIYIPGERVQL